MNAEWSEQAACLEHPPEAFFPNPTDLPGQDYAIRICHTCPVIERCRTERRRVRAHYGVWAGQYHHPTASAQ